MSRGSKSLYIRIPPLYNLSMGIRRLLQLLLLILFPLVLVACSPPVISYEEACAGDGDEVRVTGYLRLGRDPQVNCWVVVGGQEIVSCQLVLYDDIEDPQNSLNVEVQVGDETNSIAPINRFGDTILGTDITILDYRGNELNENDRVDLVGTITSSTSTQDIMEESIVMGPDGNMVAQSVVADTVVVTNCELTVEKIYSPP